MTVLNVYFPNYRRTLPQNIELKIQQDVLNTATILMEKRSTIQIGRPFNESSNFQTSALKRTSQASNGNLKYHISTHFVLGDDSER